MLLAGFVYEVRIDGYTDTIRIDGYIISSTYKSQTTRQTGGLNTAYKARFPS